MNAAQMVEEKIVELTGTTKQLSPRNVSSFLESLSFQMEKDDHKLARDFARANLFRVMQESTRIVEIEEVNVLNNDHNLVEHHQYDEFEQI